jgi:hypothetical protein
MYLKACLKMVIFSSYVRRSLPFVSRFISILIKVESISLTNNPALEKSNAGK